MPKKILIIDDEQAVLNFLKVLLLQTGKYETEIVRDSRLASEKLKAGEYDLLLLDMDMPEVTGIEILRFIKEHAIDIETIVLTGVDDVELAVSAMKAGAYDYLKKPIDNELLLLTMERALERKSMRRELAELRLDVRRESLENPHLFDDIITASSKMIRIFRYVEKIAGTNTSVLIQGESGTGKELIARAVHRGSIRSSNSFVAVNAGVFARELFASELFGHAKGAFSGAYSDKKGFLEEAHEGTLFLDEIGELPMEAQVKLLRVLQDGEYFKVGSTKMRHADIRLLAATNKNLWDEIEKGQFRKDLFFRLNVNTISLPPLREREGDIALLSRYFLREFSLRNDKKIKDLSREVLDMLEAYHFPGNVRELQNIIQSAVLMEQTETLKVSSLPIQFVDRSPGGSVERSGRSTSPAANDTDDKVLSLEEVEREHIRGVLEMTAGNRTRTAKLLKISRVTLISKMKKFSLS